MSASSIAIVGQFNSTYAANSDAFDAVCCVFHLRVPCVWLIDCVAVTKDIKLPPFENTNERHFRKFPECGKLSTRITLTLQPAAVWTINLSRNPATNKQGKQK